MSNTPEKLPGDISSTRPKIERFVILANPVATGAVQSGEGRKKGDPSLSDRVMKIVFSKIANIEPIETTPNRADDEAKLRETLRAGDVVCIAGGDGTANRVINALMDKKFKDVIIPILPLWGGDVNDLAHALNGLPDQVPVRQIVEEGEYLPIYATRWEIEHKDTRTRRAGLYSGAASTGVTASNLEALRGKWGYDTRWVRRARQGGVMLNGLVNKEEVYIRDRDGKRKIHDLSVVSNDVMAKILKFPVNVREPRLFRSEVRVGESHASSNFMWRALSGNLQPGRDGTYMEPGESYDFTVLTDTMVHFDNEAEPLLAGSEVSISQEDRPFYGLSLPSH